MFELWVYHFRDKEILVENKNHLVILFLFTNKEETILETSLCFGFKFE